jgi:hypothetical protein
MQLDKKPIRWLVVYYSCHSFCLTFLIYFLFLYFMTDVLDETI